MQTANDNTAHPPWRADPDAELLRAWANWLDGCRALNALPADAPNDVYERLERVLDAVERAIENLPVRTVAGAVAKLKVALAAMDHTAATQGFVIDGGPVPELLGMDFSAKLLWGLVQDLEQIGAPATA